MEATDARRAFPCFDEPAMKASFSVSTTIDARDTAISNGRTVSDTPGPGAGKHTLTFSASPKMSSYLVALAVGDWACSSGSADGVPIRVCATPDRKDQLGFALQSAEFAMRYYNRYFTIKSWRWLTLRRAPWKTRAPSSSVTVRSWSTRAGLRTGPTGKRWRSTSIMRWPTSGSAISSR
jgi:hypothetical protein